MKTKRSGKGVQEDTGAVMPKRGSNPYCLFLAEWHSKNKTTGDGVSAAEKSKKIAEEWNAMADGDK